MSRQHLLRAALIPALLVGLTTACSEPPPVGGSAVVDPGAPEPQPTPTPALPTAPLTGVPVSAAPLAARPAVAAPIRVTTSTATAGLASADLVYLEFAESDTLHLTAVFQSRDAAKIGPVTEIHPVDVRSLGVLRPFVGYDGGPTGFLTQFENSGLKGVTPDDGGGLFADHHISTAALYKAAPKGGTAPTGLFDHAEPGTALATRDVTAAGELTVTVPGGPPQTWRYDVQKAVWVGKVGTTAVTATSLMVLTMPYRTLTVRHPELRSVPAANVFGEGAAVAVSGPFAAKAKWRKPGQNLVCHLTDLAGYQLRPLPGNTWVIYAPTTAKVTVR